jgi:hypothetical protein
MPGENQKGRDDDGYKNVVSLLHLPSHDVLPKGTAQRSIETISPLPKASLDDRQVSKTSGALFETSVDSKGKEEASNFTYFSFTSNFFATSSIQ